MITLSAGFMAVVIQLMMSLCMFLFFDHSQNETSKNAFWLKFKAHFSRWDTSPSMRLTPQSCNNSDIYCLCWQFVPLVVWRLLKPCCAYSCYDSMSRYSTDCGLGEFQVNDLCHRAKKGELVQGRNSVSFICKCTSLYYFVIFILCPDFFCQCLNLGWFSCGITGVRGEWWRASYWE